MATPDERRFVTFLRGHVRDEVILSSFRNSLRALVNPETGVLFTEDEILTATQPGSRFYIEADAVDLYGQATQSRALFFADQVAPRRAATPFLVNHHGRLWIGDDPKLPATGGSGDVDAPATVGSIFVGSTTIGDPTASVARDPNGKRYQVLTTVVTPGGGVAPLEMQGVDTGSDTNPDAGTVLTWVANQPLGAEPEAAVSADFTGGFDIETDPELASRIQDIIRHRPAAGNAAHFRAWCREASNAVETAFVYCTAMHAGSVLVALTQKRGTATGPLARVPSVGTLADVTGFVVPPNSPVTPARAHVLVTGVTSQPRTVELRLGMAQGTGGGWYDPEPWPPYSAGFAPQDITALTNQTHFQIQTDAGSLPGGATVLTAPDAPALMVWDVATSRFIQLAVLSVTDVGANIFDIVLSQAPSGHTLATGDYISPYTDRLEVIAEALETYFDSLGPGEVIASTDTRYARAARFPRPSEEYPYRLGQGILTGLLDAMGGTLSDAELISTASSPTLPTDVVDGSGLLTLDDVVVQPL